MNTREAALLNVSGIRIQLPSFCLDPPLHLHISAETPQMGLAAAFALFDFATDQINNLGYEIERFKLPLASFRAAYVSPTPRSELSRFTETVTAELNIGSPNPVADILEKLCLALRLETLKVRRPDGLSGGETAKLIIAAHLARMPNVLILDRVLDELDRDSRVGLHTFLQETIHPVVVVTTGSYCDGFPPDAELTVTSSQVELRTEFHPSEFVSNDEIPFKLNIITNSIGSLNQRPLFSVCGLTVQRSNHEVLTNLSFSIKSGDLCWLLGPNGCGKSSLLEALCGLLPTAHATNFLIFNGKEEVVESSLAKIIAYAPQDPEGDITELTLLDEVRLAQETVVGKRTAEISAEAWLDKLAVLPKQRRLFLSDDVQNRKLASVLSAFARNRPLVLLDEPTLFLDNSGRETVSMAMAVHLSRGGGVICATHDTHFREMFS